MQLVYLSNQDKVALLWVISMAITRAALREWH